jgi:hypothetical protein
VHFKEINKKCLLWFFVYSFLHNEFSSVRIIVFVCVLDCPITTVLIKETSQFARAKPSEWNKNGLALTKHT